MKYTLITLLISAFILSMQIQTQEPTEEQNAMLESLPPDQREAIKTKMLQGNKISEDIIEHYIDKYDPYDKAGSYGIQDWFSSQIKKINGCYYNVMGLPISKVFKCLYGLSMNNLK